MPDLYHEPGSARARSLAGTGRARPFHICMGTKRAHPSSISTGTGAHPNGGRTGSLLVASAPGLNGLTPSTTAHRGPVQAHRRARGPRGRRDGPRRARRSHRRVKPRPRTRTRPPPSTPHPPPPPPLPLLPRRIASHPPSPLHSASRSGRCHVLAVAVLLMIMCVCAVRQVWQAARCRALRVLLSFTPWTLSAPGTGPPRRVLCPL